METVNVSASDNASAPETFNDRLARSIVVSDECRAAVAASKAQAEAPAPYASKGEALVAHYTLALRAADPEEPVRMRWVSDNARDMREAALATSTVSERVAALGVATSDLALDYDARFRIATRIYTKLAENFAWRGFRGPVDLAKDCQRAAKMYARAVTPEDRAAIVEALGALLDWHAPGKVRVAVDTSAPIHAALRIIPATLPPDREADRRRGFGLFGM